MSIRPPRNPPIAIVGAGLRLPGADSREEYWSLLREGRSALSEYPADRPGASAWERAGRGRPRGGFLEGLESFDATLFRIAPNEAALMDPQQRLLLETAWHALEDAGIAADDLRGRSVGAFVGLSTSDFGIEAWRAPSPEASTATGSSHAVAANRLSYVFDWTGPSLAIDTACSSSLVAVHLACQSLWTGESELCVAGGVNVLLCPEVSAGFERAGFLAGDGRCKTFDASADGYVRSEGAALVLLKPLERALADGDRILSVIRGSAVNQDGRSNGLAAPHGPAQERVLRSALGQAGLEPGDLDCIEAHGTGTRLGDPVEVEALRAVHGTRSSPLLIGSAKTNLGHLEAASGIAGLVKLCLSLDAGFIPPTVGHEDLNPLLPIQGDWAEFPCELRAWPEREGPRFAGVSSFGFGGTNAHVVLESPPRRSVPPTGSERKAQLLLLSAATPQALETLAREQGSLLAELEPSEFAQHCEATQAGRAKLEHRLALVGSSPADMARRLQCGRALSGRPGRRPPKLAFVFTGRDVGLDAVRELDLAHPAATRTIESALSGLGDALVELPAALGRNGGSSERHSGGTLAAASLITQLAHAAVLRSAGLEPELLIGCGMGELAAAVDGGMLPADSALHWVASGQGRDGRPFPSTSGSAPACSSSGEDLDVGCELLQAASRRANETALSPAVLERARELGVTHFVEIGGPLSETENRADGRLPGLSGDGAWASVLETLGRLQVLGQSLDHEGLAVTSAAARRKAMLPLYPFDRRRHWSLPERESGPPVAVRPADASPADRRGELRRELALAAPSERVRLLESSLRVELGDLLGLPPREVPGNRGFFELGLDSLGAAELQTRMEDELGIQLAETVALDAPTVTGLAVVILEALELEPEPAPAPAAGTRAAGAETESDVQQDLARLQALIGGER